MQIMSMNFSFQSDDEFGKKSISPEIYIELSDDPLVDRFRKESIFHFDFIPLVL